jgi:Domain of unknown function (DUF4260)
MKQPIIYERLEGAAIFAGSLYLYFHLHFSPIWFVVLLLVFDVSAVGYLVNSRVGAHTYNLVHSLIGPPILVAIGVAAGSRLAIGFALIWLAHIGMDRALGYGLKFSESFKQTHLGPIGKK